MSVSPIPPGYNTITTFLMLNDVKGFMEFLRTVFDAQPIRSFTTPDGTVDHAEARLGDSHLMVGDPMGKHPVRPGTMYFYVRDVNSVYQQALEAGARSISEPVDLFYGDRVAGVQDAWDNIWWLATHVEDMTETEMEERHDARSKERAVNK